MKIIEKALNGLIVFEPRVFKDERGLFFESFNEKVFSELTGVNERFTQDNHSVSVKNVVRGLHLQAPPFEQGKLVRVVKGSALDIAVDVRKNSPTYGDFFSVELNDVNNYLFWIPPGFAHGFSVLQDETVFLYKCTKPYNKDSERTIAYNDPKIGIDWKVNSPIISEKDKEGVLLNDFKSPFN